MHVYIYKVLYRTISVCYTALNIFVRLLLVRVQLFRAVDSSIRMLLGIGISVAAPTKLSSSSIKAMGTHVPLPEILEVPFGQWDRVQISFANDNSRLC